jgi:hypothetical protein
LIFPIEIVLTVLILRTEIFLAVLILFTETVLTFFILRTAPDLLPRTAANQLPLFLANLTFVNSLVEIAEVLRFTERDKRKVVMMTLLFFFLAPLFFF